MSIEIFPTTPKLHPFENFNTWFYFIFNEKSFNIQELLHCKSKCHETKLVHRSSSKAFQRYQKCNMKYLDLGDLSMKKNNLFCLFVIMKYTKSRHFILHSWCFSKALHEKGAWLAWFQIVSICGVEVLKYWMIFSLKIKLNCNWKFQYNWDVHLVFLERYQWEKFNEFFSSDLDLGCGRYWILSDFYHWKFK